MSSKLEFTGPLRSFSSSKRMEESGYFSRRWTIGVEAVPRSQRHPIQNKIIAEALPSIRRWLVENRHTSDREGSHRITFAFDELKDELNCAEYASLEWQTAQVDQ
ncbi:MAG: hypothetical protein ACKV22_36055 [Bryobacteraceae bacterium]